MNIDALTYDMIQWAAETRSQAFSTTHSPNQPTTVRTRAFIAHKGLSIATLTTSLGGISLGVSGLLLSACTMGAMKVAAFVIGFPFGYRPQFNSGVAYWLDRSVRCLGNFIQTGLEISLELIWGITLPLRIIGLVSSIPEQQPLEEVRSIPRATKRQKNSKEKQGLVKEAPPPPWMAYKGISLDEAITKAYKRPMDMPGDSKEILDHVCEAITLWAIHQGSPLSLREICRSAQAKIKNLNQLYQRQLHLDPEKLIEGIARVTTDEPSDKVYIQLWKNLEAGWKAELQVLMKKRNLAL